MNKKNNINAQIYAAGTVIIWSTVFVFTKKLLKVYSPMEVGLLRYGSASIALFIIMAYKKVATPKLKDIPWFILGGFFGFFLYIGTFNTAAGMLSSGECSFIITTSPIFTAIFAVIVFKEKILILGITSMILQLIGIAVLTIGGSGVQLNLGVFWMLAAAMALGGYNIVQRLLSKKGYNALQITSYCILFGAIMLSYTVPGMIKELVKIDTFDLFSALYLGVVAGAIAYYLWAKAMVLTTKTSIVSNYMFFIPFLTSVIGIIVLHERFTARMIVGGSIIILGFLLYTWSINRKGL